MTMLRIWPWSEITEARQIAEERTAALRDTRAALGEMERLALDQRATIDILRRDLSFVMSERDTARAELARWALPRDAHGRFMRSAPLLDHIDHIASQSADLRTELTG